MKKSMKIMLTVFVSILIVIIFLLTFAYYIFRPVEVELERIKSPDGKVEAVLVERDSGPTTSSVFKIFIVLIGETYKDSNLVFVGDHIDQLSVKWRKAKFLDIKYKEGRIFEFCNFWQPRHANLFHYVVEIRETPLTEDFALSAKDRWEGLHPDKKSNKKTS